MSLNSTFVDVITYQSSTGKTLPLVLFLNGSPLRIEKVFQITPDVQSSSSGLNICYDILAAGTQMQIYFSTLERKWFVTVSTMVTLQNTKPRSRRFLLSYKQFSEIFKRSK